MSEEANPRAPVTAPRKPVPFGRTEAFVAAVAAKHGDDYVRSWLTWACQFEEAVVWTSDLGRDVLGRDCASAIKAHGIAIRADDQSRRNFRERAEQAVLAASGVRR